MINESLKNGKCENISPEDVEKICYELNALPIIGPEIKELFETEVRTAEKYNRKVSWQTVRKNRRKFCVVLRRQIKILYLKFLKSTFNQ